MNESGSIMEAANHPTVKRFLHMVGRPDLRAEFPEQYQKNWENKGGKGTVQILHVKIAEHPCELTFSLFFNADEVIQTGIVVKYQDETLLNEVRKGDALNYGLTKRIDPVTFLKELFPTANAEAPFDSTSFTLAVDDDSETEVWRAVRQLTGKSESELRVIWEGLIATNAHRLGKDQVSPIIKTWLKRERDRLDLEYLRFAQLLLPRAQEVVAFAAPGHTCVVVGKRMRGSEIRQMIDAVEPEWWGGTFFGRNQGHLVRVAHEQKDRLLALKSFESSFEFPVEELFIDNRHIYSVVFVGQEALVWRTRHEVPTEDSGAMPAVAAAPSKGEGFLARLKHKSTPSHLSPASPPPQGAPQADENMPHQAPEAHPYLVARAEKAYMAALRAKSAELKGTRKEYLKLLYDSDRRRFANNPGELRSEIQGAIEKARRKDPAGIQKEAALIEAYVTILYEEGE